MKRKNVHRIIIFAGAFTLGMISIALISSKSINSVNWTATDDDSIVLVKNPNGLMLGYSDKSGVKILIVDGLAFKDLNRNGKLDKYEDWRLPVDERAGSCKKDDN
jgi:beta-glucosidase